MTAEPTVVSAPPRVFDLSGARVAGIRACMPGNSEDNFARCVALYGDERKAAGVVKATGIARRRVADAGVSSLDLCAAAARGLLDDCGVASEAVGAVIIIAVTIDVFRGKAEAKARKMAAVEK